MVEDYGAAKDKGKFNETGNRLTPKDRQAENRGGQHDRIRQKQRRQPHTREAAAAITGARP